MWDWLNALGFWYKVEDSISFLPIVFVDKIYPKKSGVSRSCEVYWNKTMIYKASNLYQKIIIGNWKSFSQNFHSQFSGWEYNKDEQLVLN